MSKQRGLPTREQLEAEAAQRQRELGLTRESSPPPPPTVTITEDEPKPSATTVLSKVGEEELKARLLAAGLELSAEGGLQLLKAESIAALEHVEPQPPAVRRKLPKNRTGTYRHPYPRLDGKDMIKTSFNMTRAARRELDVFFADLGPQRRNTWTEQVLLQAARRTRKAWDKKLESGAADDKATTEELEAGEGE